MKCYERSRRYDPNSNDENLSHSIALRHNYDFWPAFGSVGRWDMGCDLVGLPGDTDTFVELLIVPS